MKLRWIFFMVAIIIIIPLYKRSIKKKRIERSRVRKRVMFSLLKEYKCQLLENEISWKNKATVNNSQQKQKQQEPDIELNRSNFNSAHI